MSREPCWHLSCPVFFRDGCACNCSSLGKTRQFDTFKEFILNRRPDGARGDEPSLPVARQTSKRMTERLRSWGIGKA